MPRIRCAGGTAQTPRPASKGRAGCAGPEEGCRLSAISCRPEKNRSRFFLPIADSREPIALTAETPRTQTNLRVSIGPASSRVMCWRHAKPGLSISHLISLPLCGEELSGLVALSVDYELDQKRQVIGADVRPQAAPGRRQPLAEQAVIDRQPQKLW